MPETITIDTHEPKYHKGQEVFFFDNEDFSIKRGIIRYLAKDLHESRFSCLKNWVHKGHAYQVDVPYDSPLEMRLTLLPEYKLYPSYHDCLERQLICFKFRIENNTAGWEEKIHEVYNNFKSGKANK